MKHPLLQWILPERIIITI